jgi:hypothetical protein
VKSLSQRIHTNSLEGKTMNEFAQVSKKVFEGHYNTPYEPAEWSVTDALGHIMEFMAHHESIDEMPGLHEALQKMSAKDWEIWRTRYPEHVRDLIDPLQKKITQMPTSVDEG